MDLLWVLIVGGLIGWLSGNLFGRDVPSGVLGNITAGFIGLFCYIVTSSCPGSRTRNEIVLNADPVSPVR